MNSSKLKTVTIHASAWIVYVLLYASLWRDSDKSFAEAIILNLELLPPKVLLVYSSILYLVPHYLVTKKYGAFILGTVLLMVAATILNQTYLHFILRYEEGEAFWDLERISKRLTYLNSPLLFALTYECIKMNAQLAKAKLKAELALLRNQLQPHFFFNTLNNLYSLALQKSDLAPELILRLSAMMRYILYDANKEEVRLAEEVDFINNYIAIEKIRYGKRVHIAWSVPETLPAVEFPPLILFTFIENAFKHGVVEEIEKAEIQATLTIDQGLLIYHVSNSLPIDAHIKSGDMKGGLGLKNIEQRLQIIYGSKHRLAYHKTTDTFSASLSIPI